MNKPILIVQFRTDNTTAHEADCFREEYADHVDRLVFVNAITGALPQDVSSYAAVILGGSGEFYLSRGDGSDTWRPAVDVFIARVLAADVPLLGICFGYQILGTQQGATIVSDESMRETGTYDTMLLPAAAHDDLFAHLPAVFRAQYGHKDTLIDYPEHLIPLSRTERTEQNAFRVVGKRAWGMLFHPELNRARMQSRFSMLPDYAMNGESVEVMLGRFEDTPVASSVLHRFREIADSV